VAIPLFNYFLSVFLILVFAEWGRRVLWMGQFRRKNPAILPASDTSFPTQKVSVIVPARNEEKNIAHCLFHLMRQDHANLEIIVVDDRSDDRSPHLMENFKKLSPVPLKIVRIEKLPPGWTGKNHAMFVGSKAASGEWLLFIDADTTHKPYSVRSALWVAQKESIDFLTLAPEVECRSFWENTVQPLAVSSLALWFNTPQLNEPDSKTVLANGQFILVKNKVYEAVGGNESVKDQVVEDVALAKKVKQAGYAVRFLNGTLLYSTRMYSSLKQIFTGWTRIFVYLFNKNIPRILHKILLFLFFSLLPFVVAGTELFLRLSGNEAFDPFLFKISIAVAGWIIVVRFTGNKLLRTNPWYAFLHPLGSLVMVWILWVCVWRILHNKPSEWRGDRYQ
jgi:chlorobactene glucosyltransferase